MKQFTCIHCGKPVENEASIGTKNRNHCPFCLWSKHVDVVPGDRAATCHATMQPIALTFKHEGEEKIGEIMLVHQCEKCSKISINRVAGDDETDVILEVFEKSKNLAEEQKNQLLDQKIDILEDKDNSELQKQLFGV